MLGLQKEVADVSEGGGAFGGDAVGGEGLEELAKDVVDIDLGDEIAGGASKLVAEIVFTMEGTAVDSGVVEAKSVVLGMRGHAAAFAVGEGEGAEVVRGVGSSIAHGEGHITPYDTVPTSTRLDKKWLRYCPKFRKNDTKRENVRPFF